ncbi:MAG TPA: UDP-N-acetylmuramoyl-tripeptide--D-alanyl-D-alanine ligase [Candidatus Baltobacteraceae bacterium]|nr:UDP-N-acetylmuramoyl-tripeptide--D-alanyl-D-alanine ligase [Candidatus Baltobacteraceae bacterium]
MKLPFDEAAKVTHGVIFEIERAPERIEISTDTRTLEPGQAFLALRGQRFDGNLYTQDAVERGATALIVDDPDAVIPGIATIVVESTLDALLALAAAARNRFAGSVLAITGSAGKTTTKAFAAQLLALRYGARVLSTPANENNEIGVSKVLLAAEGAEHDVLVIEMGARHYGDIEKLVRAARPDVAILTNIGDAHLEIMGSRERLEITKWALFSTGARAVLNAQDVASIRRAPSLSAPPHWFFTGGPGENVPMYGRVTALIGSRQWIEIDGEREHTYDVDARVPGAHNRANLAAAIAAAVELGVEPMQIAPAVAEIELPHGRYERIELENGVTLIYDAYNANAAGMMAALDAFAGEDAARRIALLASMAELGEGAADLHRRVGSHAAATKVDVMLVGGEFAGELALGARSAGLPSERIVPFVTNEQAAQWVRDHTRAGDAVLLKGSRKYKLEEIVEDLRR